MNILKKLEAKGVPFLIHTSKIGGVLAKYGIPQRFYYVIFDCNLRNISEFSSRVANNKQYNVKECKLNDNEVKYFLYIKKNFIEVYKDEDSILYDTINKGFKHKFMQKKINAINSQIAKLEERIKIMTKARWIKHVEDKIDKLKEKKICIELTNTEQKNI